MNNYTMNDWARMQSDAEKRVMTAREHNKQIVGNKPQIRESQHKSKGILGLLNLDKIDFNKDTSTILMLLALLGKDGEQDDLLILALLYIML